MDANLVIRLLQNTLSPSTDERNLAEKQLRELSTQSGFAVLLLQMVANTNLDLAARQAGSIYFKNFIQKNWAPYEDEDEAIQEGQQAAAATTFHVPEQDKIVVRSNLVETIIHAPQATRSQLLTGLGKVAIADYPEKYPDLLGKLVGYLTSNDQNAIYGALLCLYELVKKYEFKNANERTPLIQIVASTYPILHRLFTTCLQLESLEAALVLKAIAKTYFSCIQYSLPKELRSPENLSPWIQVFLQLVDKVVPPVPANTDPSLKHKYPWWQAKKWAYHILNRLFSRYGNPTLSDEDYKKFSKEFLNTYSVQILQVYLKQLDLARSGAYISPRVMQLNLTFLSDAVEHSKTWKQLKGIILDLVKTVVFPLLCFSDEDQELWESDPYEYVRTKFDLYEDFRSPVPAAMSLVHQLVSARKKTTLVPVLSFCNDILLNYHASPPEQKNHRAKDGALCTIGSIAGILEKDASFSPQLEGLLVAHVFPEANSPAPFLRARACWTIYNFCDVPFSNPQNILHALQVVAKCMKDTDLPVKIQAALALGVLVEKEEVRQQIRPMLSEIMQELLNLTNESDIDDLSTVMETMIETFGEEMAPFAVTLCTQLRDTFMRMMSEAEGDDDENKALTAMGVLRTIVTFIRIMDETPAILLQLEEVFLPMIQAVLSQHLLDFLEEILEIVTTFTYASERISPAMWSVFPSIYQCFKESAFDYFSEMLPCFDNYISRDPQAFLAQGNLVNMSLDVINSLLHQNEAGEMEKADACKFIEVFLLNLPGQIDQLIPQFIESGIGTFTGAETTMLKVISLEVVINALYYNPKLSLHVLESKGWTSNFFTSWFQNIDSFNRVFDLKLCLLTLCKIFQIPYNEIPPVIQAGYHQAMAICLKLFQKVPEAYEYRKKLEEYEEEDEEEFADEIDEDLEERQEQDEDADIVNEDDMNYLNTLRKAKENEDEEDFFDDDMGLEEELEHITPLDNINEYIVFQETIRLIQQSNQATFAALTQSLDANQVQFLHQVNATADQKRIELAQPKSN